MATKKGEKKERPTPKKCVCGAAAITVKARAGHMVTCPDPMNCNANLPHGKSIKIWQ